MKTKRIGAGLAAVALLVGLAGAGADAQRGERREQRRDERTEERREEHADTNGWSQLGERTVRGGTDRDTILVTALEGRFTHAMIKVENASLELHDVVFTFSDGSTFSPTTRLVFAPGETTRSIELPGGPRVIRRVDFQVSNLSRTSRAEFELWGR